MCAECGTGGFVLTSIAMHEPGIISGRAFTGAAFVVSSGEEK
jgi:hypothetical protein